MSEQLYSELRKLIEDQEGTAYTDDQLLQFLNKYRVKLEDVSLDPEDTSYKVWIAPATNLLGVVLSDSNGVIAEANYTADNINGIYTFTTAKDWVTINCTCHDLKRTASDIWLDRAMKAQFKGPVQLGDEVIPMDKNNYDYCMAKAYSIKPTMTHTIGRGL